MKNLILWLLVTVAYFAYTCPLLVYSEKRAAKVTRSLLSIVIGGAMGFGIGDSLAAIL